MTESFKCPSCSAPLEFEGKLMQKCSFCRSNVIVPSGVLQNSSAFGGAGAFDLSDLSSLTGRALKIAEIQRLIQGGNKIQAIKVFRETFGTGLKEAKDAVEAMERGESVDISGMRVRQTRHIDLRDPQNLAAVKKVGTIIGGSMVAVAVVSGIIILGAVFLAFYFTSSSINKSLDKTSVSNSNAEKTPEKPKLAEEILKFGGEGTGAGKFKDNRSVAVDRASGRIYSGEYQGGKIQVFDSEGKYLTQWIADPKMNLYDMVADRKGSLYILNNKGIFLHQGETGNLLAHLKDVHAEGIALTLDGKIVATTEKGITIFDSNLNKIQEFKDAAERASSIFGFEAVAVDGNNQIYVLDRQNRDICKFSADGRFLNRFKAKASSLSHIAVDGKGRVFVSNGNEIYVSDSTDGKPLNSFATDQAFGMAFNDADELFVAGRPFVVKYRINL